MSSDPQQKKEKTCRSVLVHGVQDLFAQLVSLLSSTPRACIGVTAAAEASRSIECDAMTIAMTVFGIQHLLNIICNRYG